jgi:cbb3-type cytochrome oxidase subunit 3
MSELSANISGIMTALLLILFIGICIWSWSAGRKTAFEELSKLPLEDDNIKDIKNKESL